jgi:FAD/FMN-containing dehydrogenase
MPTITKPPVTEALAGLDGRLIMPGDADYDAARASFLGGIDMHPAAIVRVGSAADVARVVTYAREAGLPLAVRSGGHSPFSSTEGGMLLDLHDLKGIELDLHGRTVWAETGLTAVELSVELARHGMAVGLGDTGSVGIGGITTGGGVGYLARKFGLTIDNVLAADIVTADGQLRRVDAQSEPDLFWAVRGGGGNFGVVTRFQYRLQPVDQIVGGMLILPATPETVAGFIAAAEAAPEELTRIANVMPAPPMPFLPPESAGQVVILGMLAYTGDAEAGARALAPFRALATPLADMVRPLPYPEIYPLDDPDYHPTAVARTLFMDRVDRDVAEHILATLEASDATMRVAQLRVLGGAVNRVPADATAYAHRNSRIMVNVAAFYEGPDDRIVRQEWAERFAESLVRDDTGAYVNFLAEDGDKRMRDAYPGATWDRLVAIKSRYDPDNLFRLNQNIPPA